MELVKYYDIGLNLFCKQFPDPEKVIREAEDDGVCCILTGTDIKENKKINHFVKNQWFIVLQAIRKHWISTFPWVSLLVLQDGFAMIGVRKNCVRQYI